MAVRLLHWQCSGQSYHTNNRDEPQRRRRGKRGERGAPPGELQATGGRHIKAKAELQIPPLNSPSGMRIQTSVNHGRAGRVKLLVRKMSRFPVSGSTNRILRNTVGYSFDTACPVRTTTWSDRTPVVRSTGLDLRRRNCELRLVRVTKKAED